MIDPCVGWCWSCRHGEKRIESEGDGAWCSNWETTDCRNPAATDEDQDRGEHGLCEKWEGKRDN